MKSTALEKQTAPVHAETAPVAEAPVLGSAFTLSGKQRRTFALDPLHFSSRLTDSAEQRFLVRARRIVGKRNFFGTDVAGVKGPWIDLLKCGTQVLLLLRIKPRAQLDFRFDKNLSAGELFRTVGHT